MSFPMTTDAFAAYVLAGSATFTAKSSASGKHFTFKADKKSKEDADDVWFFSVLTDASSNSYSYIGTLFGESRKISLTRKSVFAADAPCVKALQWVLDCAFIRHEMKSVEVFHDGTCARCGRQLTHPDSIQSGLGPECSKKAGVSQLRADFVSATSQWSAAA